MFLVALAATKAAALYEGCRKDEIRELEENVRTSCPEYHFQFEFPFHLVLEGTIKTDMFCARAVEGLAHLVGGYACSDSDVKRQAPHLLELRKMSQTLQSTRLSSSAPTLGAPRRGMKMPNGKSNQMMKKLERLLPKVKKGGKLAARYAPVVCQIAKLLFKKMENSNLKAKSPKRVYVENAIEMTCDLHGEISPLIKEELRRKNARQAKKAARTAEEDRLDPSAHREGETRRRANGRAHDSDNDRDYLRLGDEMDAEEEFFGTDAARWDYEF